MRRFTLIAALVFFPLNSAFAQSFKMEPGPKSPEESLKCINVRPGFTVELMAAEPLVMDPIAFAWGPDGKFWVVEMGDYPLGVDGKNKFGGNVKFLTKTKDDGPYTKATTFLDNLGYPTGVTPWGKGVIVTCAPDIFYAEDTTGSGKADKKIVLFTGFREGNQQHRVNGLVWGLDNWLYGANGDSGGIIKAVNALERQPDGSHRARKLDKPGPGLNISGRDFRLKPDTGEIEAVTGQTQFGRCRDDFGNWFGCNNSNPMYHFVLEDRYLKRNPHILYPDPKVNVSVTPGAAKVYPISKALPRFNTPGAVGYFTSACSVMIYRDNLFGSEFYGNSFVAEPVHNLIHREIMNPKGVTFTSQRADDEQTSEFLASSDNWFRPTTIATGPDGAIWVADMYRYVIEHPEWIPLDWQKKLELRAGHDMGRIYRVYPKDKTPRAIPRMDKMEAKELVKALESPNGWVRDTAQQELVLPSRTSSFRPDRMALMQLRGPAYSAATAVQALATLATFELQIVPARLALDHSDSRVRRWGVAALEAVHAANPNSRVLTEISRAEWDREACVRLQVALSCGVDKQPAWGKVLAEILSRDGDDRYITAAALSSINAANCKTLLEELGERDKVAERLLPPLFRLAQVHGETKSLARLMVKHYLASSGKVVTSEQLFHVANLFDTIGGADVVKILRQDNESYGKKAAEFLGRVHDRARQIVAASDSPVGERLNAVRVLGRGVGSVYDDMQLLQQQLTPAFSDEIQSAAVTQFGAIVDPRVPRLLLANWKGYSPAVRNRVLDVMLSRVEWTRMSLEAIEQGKILRSEIDAVRRQRLLDHRDEEIRETCAKLLAVPADADRAKVVEMYLKMFSSTGDSTKGAKLFEKHCAACHQLAGIGQQVGPDLASVGDKSPQGLLVAILDPNKAVEARYVNYVATTKAGLTVSGLLQSETSTTITLVAADGKKHDLLRKDLDELTSTGKSVMPEGFEKEIPPAAMADLIAFLRGNLAKPKTFAGNRPETVKGSSDGSLKLLASNASIFGKTLVFEEKFKNLGYWASADDQAVWSIDVPKEGRYDVWIDYACETAGNSFTLQIGDARLTQKVNGTASWELYRRVKIGTLRLNAGRQDATMRVEGAIRGALIDLKEIQLAPAQD